MTKGWNREEFWALRNAEAERKAHELPASHLCDVSGTIHQACDVDGLLISKGTGKVLGHNCGGVKVSGLMLGLRASKVKGALLKLFYKMLASEAVSLSFDPDLSCAGEWAVSLRMHNRDYSLVFHLGWRWLHLKDSELRCELTSDEYDAIESTLNSWKPRVTTKRERTLRKALAVFHPMVPPHVMTELERVIDRHLEKIRKFEANKERR